MAEISVYETSQALASTITTGVTGVSRAYVQNGEIVVEVPRESLIAVMTTLRDDPRFACEQVMEICGVDWPEREQRFGF